MKIVETIDAVSAGNAVRSRAWRAAWMQVQDAIQATGWPHGSRTFTIRPEAHGNGVLPIKMPCIRRLQKLGWLVEGFPPLPEGALTPGDLDALLNTPQGYFAFEWETGNISSSHRAINKLLLALSHQAILGGFLVVPSNALYPFLTDRVGNINELRPYFALWQAVPVQEGCLRIVVVEHDKTSLDVPLIPKGTDGRARG